MPPILLAGSGKRRKLRLPYGTVHRGNLVQRSFEFTPGLTVQFPRLRDIVCAVVYSARAGLKGVAADLDVSPSELSRMLNREQDDPRKLDVEDFVAIVASTGDTRPVQWLIERFLHDPEERKAMAAAQIAQIVPFLAELVRQAGVAVEAPPKAKR